MPNTIDVFRLLKLNVLLCLGILLMCADKAAAATPTDALVVAAARWSESRVPRSGAIITVGAATYHADIAMTTKYGQSSMLNVTRPANAQIVEMVMKGGQKGITEAAAWRDRSKLFSYCSVEFS